MQAAAAEAVWLFRCPERENGSRFRANGHISKSRYGARDLVAADRCGPPAPSMPRVRVQIEFCAELAEFPGGGFDRFIERGDIVTEHSRDVQAIGLNSSRFGRIVETGKSVFHLPRVDEGGRTLRFEELQGGVQGDHLRL